MWPAREELDVLKLSKKEIDDLETQYRARLEKVETDREYYLLNLVDYASFVKEAQDERDHIKSILSRIASSKSGNDKNSCC